MRKLLTMFILTFFSELVTRYAMYIEGKLSVLISSTHSKYLCSTGIFMLAAHVKDNIIITYYMFIIIRLQYVVWLLSLIILTTITVSIPLIKQVNLTPPETHNQPVFMNWKVFLNRTPTSHLQIEQNSSGILGFCRVQLPRHYGFFSRCNSSTCISFSVSQFSLLSAENFSFLCALFFYLGPPSLVRQQQPECDHHYHDRAFLFRFHIYYA